MNYLTGGKEEESLETFNLSSTVSTCYVGSTCVELLAVQSLSSLNLVTSDNQYDSSDSA